MADQTLQLPACVRGAFLGGQQSRAEVDNVTRALLAGHLDVLYVAPERLALPRFVRLLARVPLAFACVDEAHCVASWSHNFRPSYLRLHHTLRVELRVPT